MNVEEKKEEKSNEDLHQVNGSHNSNENLYDNITQVSQEENDYCQVKAGFTYAQIDKNKVLQPTSCDYMIPFKKSNSKTQGSHNVARMLTLCLLIGFIIQTFVVSAITSALLVILIQISDLKSDVNSITKLPDSACKCNSDANTLKLNNDINLLQNIFKTSQELLQHDINISITYIDSQISDLISLQDELISNMHRTSGNISYLKSNLTSTITESFENFASNLNNLTVKTFESMSLLNYHLLQAVEHLQIQVINDLQANVVFDSCASIMNLSLPFPSGMYFVRHSFGSKLSVQVYCNMELSCNGTTGGWTRVAYLNTSASNFVMCPQGLQARNNPPSCRHNFTAAGCSSVTYETFNFSYTKICGTILARYSGTPDAFNSHSNLRNNSTLEDNYVDGVSLTYRDDTNRAHIWTYAVSVGNGCTSCSKQKPAYIGENFTCTRIDSCRNRGVCSSYQLWTEPLCFGKSTFFRQLSQSTSEDLEMRVCRDQSRSDEDILLTLVDINVL